jgi:hypothetical protein
MSSGINVSLEQFAVSAGLTIVGLTLGWAIGLFIRGVIMDLVDEHIRKVVRDELAPPEASGLHNNRRG